MFLQYLKLRYFTKYEGVKKFSFDGLKKFVYVSSVYDGDTITIIFNHNGHKIKLSCRFLGIDTPELRTKDLSEKKKGYAAKYYLQERVLEKIKYVEFLQNEKYGRTLIRIYDKKQYFKKNKYSINQEMIDKKHAVPYMV